MTTATIAETAQWILNQYPSEPITPDNATLIAVDIVKVVTGRLGFEERRLMDPDPQVTDLVRESLRWFATGVRWNPETPFQDAAVAAVGRYIRELRNE